MENSDEFVKNLRLLLGLTQEEFAHKLGVGFVTVNRWENKHNKPSRMAMKILTALAEETIRDLH
jgi:putative transcriptional regulator